MATNHPEAQWFPGAGFGIFMHWGPYSIRHIEASWPLQPDRPQHIPVDEYESLAEEFRPQAYDPHQWARACKEAGAAYAVLTSKHHDGYCLFSTATTDYCAPRTGPRRDLVRPYVEAFRKAGLKVGLYFSLIDWHDPDFATIPIRRGRQSPKPFRHDPGRWNHFLVRVYEQIRELLTNYGRIDLLWFDVPEFGASRWGSHELKKMMLDLQPHLIVNDRLPEAGDFQTPEQNIPFPAPSGWWESCMTMNHQWGYHPDPSPYKSSRQLVRYLAEAAGMGGNLLLNVGPTPEGRYPEPAHERLRDIGRWMSHSGQSVRGVERGPDRNCFYGPITQRGTNVYLHVFDPPLEEVILRGLASEPRCARLLRNGEELRFTVDWGKGIHIELPRDACDPLNTVVVIELDRPPRWSW